MKKLSAMMDRCLRKPLLAAGLLMLIASCGGVGVGGTGTYASGPITALGSIFVQGVEFDNDSAQIIDSFGAPLPASKLTVGSVVRLTSGPISEEQNSTAKAIANRIVVDTELLGPINALDLVRNSLTVLNQQVRLDEQTVFAPQIAGGLASLRPGDVLQVFGFFDPKSRSYLATRLEPQPGALRWLINGPIDSVDSAQQIIMMGNASISYAKAANVPDDLEQAGVAGRMQRIALAVKSFDADVFSAVDFAGQSAIITSADARIGGLITSIRTPTDFSIADVAIDASGAVIQGQSRLQIGAKAQVRGQIVDGIVKASSVLIPEDSAFLSRQPFEGPIESIDQAGQTITVQGETIWLGRPVPDELLILPAGATLEQLRVGLTVRLQTNWVEDTGRYEAYLIKLQ